MRKFYLLVIFIVLIGTYACRKKGAKASWDTDVLLPLFTTSLSIADIAGNDQVVTNANQYVSVVFKEQIADMNMDSLVVIPDTIIEEQLSVPFTINANPGMTFYSNNETTTYNLVQVELKQAVIESGFAEVEFISSVQEKTIITYSLPSATKNGAILQLTEYVPKPPVNGSITVKKIINLSGYTLDLRGPDFNKVNTIYTVASAMVDPSASGAVTVTPSTVLKIKNKFVDIVPYSVKGYLGQHQVSFGPAQQTFSGLQNILSGSIDLEDVLVTLDIRNAFGVDIKAKLNQLAMKNTQKNIQVPLAHSIIGSNVFINRATEIPGTPPVSYTFFQQKLNAQNSNTDVMLEILPDALLYDLQLEVNPLGNVSNGNDFIYKNYPMEATLEIEIPLSLSSSGLLIQHTAPISISKEEGKSHLNEGIFYLYTENGFPFEATMKLELLDDAGKVLAILAPEEKINAAPLHTNQQVLNPVKDKLPIRLNRETTEMLYHAKTVRVQAAFTTLPSSTFVKIYEHYRLHVQLVADANIRMVAN